MGINWSFTFKRFFKRALPLSSHYSLRFIVYLIGISLLPFFFLGVYFNVLLGKQREIERIIFRLEEKTKFLTKNKERQEVFAKEFGFADKEFLHKKIEPLTFLKKDIQILSQVEDTSYAPLKERLLFLTGDANKIVFEKFETQETAHYYEITWHLKHKVEVDLVDLAEILTLLEREKDKTHPQIIIKKIELKLKDEESLSRQFILDLELIQRGCHESYQN